MHFSLGVENVRPLFNIVHWGTIQKLIIMMDKNYIVSTQDIMSNHVVQELSTAKGCIGPYTHGLVLIGIQYTGLYNVLLMHILKNSSSHTYIGNENHIV